MMATTHVFVGLALFAPVAVVMPELAVPIAVGAIIGGLAPDFDIAFEHRRSFHFPVLGAIPAIGASGVAILLSGPVSVGVAVAAVTAWVHAVSDAFGSGPELDQWTNPTDRAVYNHARGRWIRPRRWVRYDGAPEDGLLAIGLATIALVVYDGWITALVVVGVVVSIVYTLLRRRLVEWTPEWLD